LYYKNNGVLRLLSQALCLIGSLANWMFKLHITYKPSNYVLGLIFVVNNKFPWATYHAIVPSTEELYCLIRYLLFSFA